MVETASQISVAKQPKAAVCGGIFLRCRGADWFELGAKETDERISGRRNRQEACPAYRIAARRWRNVRLHHPAASNSEASEPGKHRVKARAHCGATMVGVTDKVTLMPQVQIPEDTMKEFGAIMRVEKIPVAPR
jgi:hypothetical protein